MRGEIPLGHQHERAELFSLDGVVFSSRNPFPFEQAAKSFSKPPLEYFPDPIEYVETLTQEIKFLPPDQAKSYFGQFACSVTNDMWHFLWSRNADVFGNTGRPDIPPWWHLTERTLSHGLVDTRFAGTFYRSHGLDGVASKGHAIRTIIDTELYERVTHYDNNPWVSLGLARKIPEAFFVLVQDAKTLDKHKITQERLSDEFGDRVTVTEVLESSDGDPRGIEKPAEKETVIYSYFEERKKQQKRSIV